MTLQQPHLATRWSTYQTHIHTLLPSSFTPWQFRKRVSSTVPLAGKGTLHFSNACLSKLWCGRRRRSSRRDPPLERRASEMKSWRRMRQNSSGNLKSCLAKSFWPPGSRSSGLPAGARAPAEPRGEQRGVGRIPTPLVQRPLRLCLTVGISPFVNSV